MMSEEKEEFITLNGEMRPKAFWEMYVEKMYQSEIDNNATIQAQQANLQAAADLLEAERAKVAHRDELLRIQGEACERYKAAIEDARQALSNQTHGGAQYQPDVLEADSILANALGESEAIPTANAAPKFKVGDRVRIKETGQTAIIIETNIFGLHFFDTNATGLRGGFYDSDLRYEESESE